MSRKNWLAIGLITGAVAGGAVWRGARNRVAEEDTQSPADARHLLERAVSLVRLPTSPDSPPEVLPDGSGLRCPVTGHIYPYRDGVLDLLAGAVPLTATQHSLNTPVTAWAYDRLRDVVMPHFSLPAFPREVAMIQQTLQVQPGDTILDLACGHGNFTVEWAKRVGPTGLVLGIDISPAMLARAARHVYDWGLDNVLLTRGDAHQLSLADCSIDKVNCSGGFHQLPDLPRALAEIARISVPGAVLTASTFAEAPHDPHASTKRSLKERFDLHYVPLERLGQQLEEAGYQEYHWSLPGGWFGYTSARKTWEATPS